MAQPNPNQTGVDILTPQSAVELKVNDTKYPLNKELYLGNWEHLKRSCCEALELGKTTLEYLILCPNINKAVLITLDITDMLLIQQNQLPSWCKWYQPGHRFGVRSKADNSGEAWTVRGDHCKVWSTLAALDS